MTVIWLLVWLMNETPAYRCGDPRQPSLHRPPGLEPATHRPPRNRARRQTHQPGDTHAPM